MPKEPDSCHPGGGGRWQGLQGVRLEIVARNTAEEETEDMVQVEKVGEEIVWQQEPEDVYDDTLEAELILPPDCR